MAIEAPPVPAAPLASATWGAGHPPPVPPAAPGDGDHDDDHGDHNEDSVLEQLLLLLLLSQLAGTPQQMLLPLLAGLQQPGRAGAAAPAVQPLPVSASQPASSQTAPSSNPMLDSLRGVRDKVFGDDGAQALGGPADASFNGPGGGGGGGGYLDSFRDAAGGLRQSQTAVAHSRDRLSAIIDRYDAEKKVERNKFDSVLARTEELLKTADSYPDDAQRTAFVAQVHHWALTEIEAILARELAGAERTKVDIEGETASLTKQFMSESPGGRQAAAPEMYRYLVAKGFTPAQAAGILGNIHVESGFNARAYNRREGAFGLCQWRGARLANLQNFARAQGKSVADWRVQLDFVSHELNGSHAGAGARLAAAGTPAQAAAVFDQYYERSSGHARGRRIAAANAIAGY